MDGKRNTLALTTGAMAVRNFSLCTRFCARCFPLLSFPLFDVDKITERERERGWANRETKQRKRRTSLLRGGFGKSWPREEV